VRHTDISTRKPCLKHRHREVRLPLHACREDGGIFENG
jgi:hypothetical protein